MAKKHVPTFSSHPGHGSAAKTVAAYKTPNVSGATPTSNGMNTPGKGT